MPELIETSDYAAVRAAIDISLDELSLPDDIIALDIYKGLATRLIQQKTISIDLFSKGAAATLCAALLCPAVPSLKSETDAGVTTEREPLDYAKRAAELRAMSNGLLALSMNVTVSSSTAKPTMFTVASGNRGQ